MRCHITGAEVDEAVKQLHSVSAPGVDEIQCRLDSVRDALCHWFCSEHSRTELGAAKWGRLVRFGGFRSLSLLLVDDLILLTFNSHWDGLQLKVKKLE